MTTQKIGTTALTNEANDFKVAIRSPATNGTYPIDMNAISNYDIISADFQTDTGTITAKFQIEGVDVEFSGGDELLSLSSTAGSETTTSAASVSTNDVLTMVLTSASGSPVLASIDLYCRRTP